MHVTLREVTPDDSKLLYHLLKERPKQANISHDGNLPIFEEHEVFVKSNPYDHWYIINGFDLGADRDVGAIYITDRNEIGIAVLKRFHRKGFASAAIRELMQLVPRDNYLANIAPSNMESQRMFKRMKFKCVQYTLKL